MAKQLQTSLKPQDLVVVIALLVVGAVTYFLALPQATALKAKSTELKAKQAQVKGLNQQVADLTSLGDRLATYDTDIDRLATAYPKDEQAVEALIQAQTMTEQASVSAGTLSPGKGKSGSLPMNLTVTGSYESVSRFIRQLNDNLRPVLVESVALTAAGEKAGNGVTASVVTSFAYDGAATTAAVPPTLPTGNTSSTPKE